MILEPPSLRPYAVFPHLSTLDATLARELLFSQRHFPLHFLGKEWNLRFVESQIALQSAISLGIRVDHQEAVLSFVPAANSEILKRITHLGGWESWERPFRSALTGIVYRGVLDALEQLLQLPIEITAAETLRLPKAIYKNLYFEIFSETDSLEASGRFCVPQYLLTRLLEILTHLPYTPPLYLEEFPISGWCIFGESMVTRTELKQLQVGSIILLEEHSAFDSHQGYFLIDGWGRIPFRCDMDMVEAQVHNFTELAHQFTVDEGSASPLTASSKSTHSLLQPSTKRSTVKLRFALEHQNLPLGHVGLLDLHDMLELEYHSHPEIQILQGFQVIGMGQWVDICGKKGVFIRSLHI